MQISTRQSGTFTIVDVVGDIDLYNSPEIRKVLLENIRDKKVPRIIINLKEVRYIDSSGVASLIEAFQKARKAGRKFVLAAVSESALRVLNLARMDKVFAICPSVAEGLAQVR